MLTTKRSRGLVRRFQVLSGEEYLTTLKSPGNRHPGIEIAASCRLEWPRRCVRRRCIKGFPLQRPQSIENSILDLPEISRIKAFPLIRLFDHGVREAIDSGRTRPGLAAVKSEGRHQRGHEASRTPRAILLFARSKVLASRCDAKGARQMVTQSWLDSQTDGHN